MPDDRKPGMSSSSPRNALVNTEQPSYRLGRKDHLIQQRTYTKDDPLHGTHYCCPERRHRTPPQYTEYADVFSERTFDILPPRHDFDHAIDLKELFVPKVAKLYPLNPQEVDTCQEFIEENLKTGQIRPSKSLQASPFFFVKRRMENYDQYKIIDI